MTAASPTGEPAQPLPRQRSIRFRLTTVFLTVALLSVLLVGAINFIMARQLLNEGIEEQLASVGESRAKTIEVGIDRFRTEVRAVATDQSMAESLVDLSTAFDELQTAADEPADVAALEAFYDEEVVGELQEIGVDDVTASDLIPTTEAGRYLQDNYLVDRLRSGTDPAELTDPGDGSSYSEAHARHHPILTQLADDLIGGDLLLIDRTGTIVYSTQKRLDLGTSLDVGPYRNAELADAVLTKLPLASSREAVLADWQLYLPASGKPTMFVVATIRQDSAPIGAIAVEVPSEALSAVTTARGEWEAVGLPTGESYVVGPDLLLRSESRRWIEDPARYLEVAEPDEALLIERFGSPVGIQTVDTEPARTALGGERFDGTATNYLDQKTYSSALPLDIAGVNWIVVVDTPLEDTRAILWAYGRRMGLLLAILVPAAGLIGYLFAGWFSRSIPPLVEAAKAVALGERKPVVPSSGGGELTDLGERLELVAHELEQQEQQLEEEYESRRDLLLSVLPSRLVNHEGEVGDEVDAVRRATAISIDLELAGRSASSDPPAAALAGSLRDDVITAGAELGIEPVRLAADRSLFITGAASESVEADNALRFAAIVSAKIHALDHEHGDGYAVRVGLASGTVATGVLEAGALTFAAWGNPVRRALAIGALARPDEIMVDYTTVAELSSDEFDLEPATNVISLDGQPMDVKRFRPREPSASSGVEPPTSNQDEPDPSPSDGAVR